MEPNKFMKYANLSDVSKGKRTPTEEELKMFSAATKAFDREYEAVKAAIENGGSRDKSTNEQQEKTVSTAPPVINGREKYLVTSHLDNEAYRKNCQAIGDEIKRNVFSDVSALKSRQKELYKSLLNEYKTFFTHFTTKQDVDVNKAIEHIRDLAQRIKEDRSDLSNFSSIEDAFFSATNTSLSKFEDDLKALVDCFDAFTNLSILYGDAFSSNEIERAKFVDSAYGLIFSQHYQQFKNAFARLSYYSSILKKEKAYYDAIISVRPKSKEPEQPFKKRQSANISQKTLCIIAVIFSFISFFIMRASVGFNPFIFIAIVCAIFIFTVYIPTKVQKSDSTQRQSFYQAMQDGFADEYILEVQELIEQIPSLQSDVNYVVRAAQTTYNTFSKFDDFLRLNIKMCNLSYTSDELHRYSKYFNRVSSLSEAKARYIADENQRIQREAQEKFKKDVTDAIERANTQRNIMIASAIVDIQKTNQKITELEEAKNKAIQDAIDDITNGW